MICNEHISQKKKKLFST